MQWTGSALELFAKVGEPAGATAGCPLLPAPEYAPKSFRAESLVISTIMPDPGSAAAGAVAAVADANPATRPSHSFRSTFMRGRVRWSAWQAIPIAGHSCASAPSIDLVIAAHAVALDSSVVS